MNEQQAVLDFFAQAENLPLGLAVAEQMDSLRERMNTQFWRDLQLRIQPEDVTAHTLAWHVELTEDRNAAGSIVGLYCQMKSEQPLYLRPMLEQQFLGNEWRIYYGLMWSASPSPAQLALPAVAALQQALQQAGYKSNENFLAWKWTPYRPRGSGFLQRYAQQPVQLLDEAAGIFDELLTTQHEAVALANAALHAAPRSAPVSLDRLRSKHPNPADAGKTTSF